MIAAEDQARAAMRAIAATVDEAPPLRLAPAPDGPHAPGAPIRQSPRERGWRTWIAPVTAAAAVMALAISLVVIRDIPNGGVVPPASPASVAGAVPPYYVTLYRPPEPGRRPSAATTDLLVGDTVTGAKVAIVPAPNGSYFSGVAAAADDRTFVADATTTALPATKTWYLLRITPGTAAPARLTRLSIPALVLSSNATIYGMALSGSGSKLAVAVQAPDLDELLVYSVAGGKLLRRWSTKDSQAFGLGYFEEQSRALAWIDGDQAIAFAASFMAEGARRTYFAEMTWRRVDATAHSGDLMADSTVIWSLRPPLGPSPVSTASSCQFNSGITTELISVDGKTVVCGSVSLAQGTMAHPVAWRVAWLAFSVRTGAVRTLYQVTVRTVLWPYIFGLWTSTSGNTIIGEWGKTTPDGYDESPHVGVISHGTFRQLPSPPDDGPTGPSVTW
jgi:hypothetical protein